MQGALFSELNSNPLSPILNMRPFLNCIFLYWSCKRSLRKSNGTCCTLHYVPQEPQTKSLEAKSQMDRTRIILTYETHNVTLYVQKDFLVTIIHVIGHGNMKNEYQNAAQMSQSLDNTLHCH